MEIFKDVTYSTAKFPHTSLPAAWGPYKASKEGDIQIFSAKTENRTDWVVILPNRSKN